MLLCRMFTVSKKTSKKCPIETKILCFFTDLSKNTENHTFL